MTKTELQKRVTELENLVNTLNEKHAEEIGRLIKEHNDEINNICSEYNSTSDKVYEEHRKELKELEEAHNEDMKLAFENREREEIWREIAKLDSRVNLLLDVLHNEHPDRVPVGI